MLQLVTTTKMCIPDLISRRKLRGWRSLVDPGLTTRWSSSLASVLVETSLKINLLQWRAPLVKLRMTRKDWYCLWNIKKIREWYHFRETQYVLFYYAMYGCWVEKGCSNASSNAISAGHHGPTTLVFIMKFSGACISRSKSKDWKTRIVWNGIKVEQQNIGPTQDHALPCFSFLQQSVRQAGCFYRQKNNNG